MDGAVFEIITVPFERYLGTCTSCTVRGHIRLDDEDSNQVEHTKHMTVRS